MQYTPKSRILEVVARLLPEAAMDLFVKAANSDEALDHNQRVAAGWAAVKGAGWVRKGQGRYTLRGAEMSNFIIRGKIAKTQEDQCLIFGWASVVEKDGAVVDSQGDIIEPSELELAVYDYVLFKREAGEMHEEVTGIGQLIESVMFTEEKQTAMGLAKGSLPVGWWVGYKLSPEVFAKVKSGEYPMMSIGGSAVRETIDAGS